LSEFGLKDESLGIVINPSIAKFTSERTSLDRRSRIETYCDVLYSIGSGAEKPTHIMYKANLSWNVLDNHISRLVKKGLVIAENEQGKRKYHLSERGFRVLKQFIVLRQELDLGSDEDIE
jgi:predicted transcriptional regulator